MGKGARLQVSTGILKPCPKCGKIPKVYRDIDYEIAGFGAWCTIECKPFLRKPHFKVEQGKPMNKWIWSIALKNSVAIICWTFLAYHFDKWWIALFGALFLTSVEWGKKDND